MQEMGTLCFLITFLLIKTCKLSSVLLFGRPKYSRYWRISEPLLLALSVLQPHFEIKENCAFMNVTRVPSFCLSNQICALAFMYSVKFYVKVMFVYLSSIYNQWSIKFSNIYRKLVQSCLQSEQKLGLLALPALYNITKSMKVFMRIDVLLFCLIMDCILLE